MTTVLTPTTPVDGDGWRAHWDSYAPVYEDVAFGGEGVSWVAAREVDAVRAHLPAEPGRALDVGAGTGRATRLLASRGWDVTAVDLSDGMLEQLRAAVPGIDARQARLGEPLPFDDAAFDAVVSLRVLKYVDRQDVAVQEIARVLRPGGVAILEWGSRRSLARWGYGDAPVRLVTPGDVRALAASAGLDVQAVVAGTRLPHRAWLAAKTASRCRVLAAAERLVAAPLPGATGARSFITVLRA